MEERYQRLTRGKSGRTLADELNEIAMRCGRRPVVSRLTPDEIRSYGENGRPGR